MCYNFPHIHFGAAVFCCAGLVWRVSWEALAPRGAWAQLTWVMQTTW
jgi:hypothetical protein